MSKLKVWDFPIRFFHWSLVILMVVCFYTSYNLSAYYSWNINNMDISFSGIQIHQYAGIGILILILFRIIWGFIGSSHARFWDFIRGPKTIINYLKTDISPTEGHNPAGGYMVLAFIIIILMQVTLGLFLEDNTYMFKNAPLASYINGDLRVLFKQIHTFGRTVLYVMIALHLLAISFYAIIKHKYLIPAMITGRRSYNQAHSKNPENLRYDRPFLGFIIFAAIASISLYFLNE